VRQAADGAAATRLISKPVPLDEMTRLLQASQIGKNANREPGAD
jgi:hypothetical protein